jgi:6-pyruvoyltetrahydropterin/6-carboxytetrahydropterin synthase
LRGYRGKCESLHGHRFQVTVTVKAHELDGVGIAYDFSELRGHLGEVLERFDHTCLNEITPFDATNPSSENIAFAIYQELQRRLSAAPVSISSVKVCESPDSSVTYTP